MVSLILKVLNSVAVAGNNTYYSLNAIETLDYINTSPQKIFNKRSSKRIQAKQW